MSTRPNRARAPGSAHGTCRDRRRKDGERRAWVHPFRRANNALYASFRLIASTLHIASVCERRAHRRPIQASRKLNEAADELVQAAWRLMRAAQQLANMAECMARQPEDEELFPEIVLQTAARWVYMAQWLQETAEEVFALHHEVLDGLESGELVPEPEPRDRRRRIRLAPRPVPIRAFLAARQQRATDRISPLLGRRRRTPRPAALRVPRRSVLGRAPPLVSLRAL